ncbi:MAG: efflux RND transporter periplasmic adaptor subunit, partial [Bradyrhizobium sp.]
KRGRSPQAKDQTTDGGAAPDGTAKDGEHRRRPQGDGQSGQAGSAGAPPPQAGGEQGRGARPQP